MKSQVTKVVSLAGNVWGSRSKPIVYACFGMSCFLVLLLAFLFKDPTDFSALPEPVNMQRTVLAEGGDSSKSDQSYVHLVWAKHEMKVTQVAVAGAAPVAAGAEDAGFEQDGFGSEEGFAAEEEGFGEEAGFGEEVAAAPMKKNEQLVLNAAPKDAVELALEDGFAEEAGLVPAPEAFDEDGFGEESVATPTEITIDLIAMVDGMKKLPAGLAALPPAPKVDPAKVELGQKLYFDKRLSGDGKSSCATCHAPDKGYSDGHKTSIGFAGKVLGRHSPTVLNAVYNKVQFWDGRAKTLKEQAAGPLMADVEMNAGSPEKLAALLAEDADYVKSFETIYKSKPTLDLITDAIAEFESTIVTPDSPFDRYVAGDKKAMNDSQKRGLALFFGKARCTSCHTGVNFTDDLYHNLGLVDITKKDADLGRYAVTKLEKDKGCFKTPTVRNAELTAPYMHDGSVATLMELVEYYDKGGHDAPNKSDLLKPLNLNQQEKVDLVNFMKALTGKLPKVSDPWAKTEVTQTNSPAKKADMPKEAKLSLLIPDKKP